MTALSPEERRIAILQMLERDASVQVTQIAEAFGVSRVTARTDLDALARDGKLRRTHGGATSLSRTLTVSVQDRRINLNVDAKRIARRAASLVEEGDSILIDPGPPSSRVLEGAFRACRHHRGHGRLHHRRLRGPVHAGNRRHHARRSP